MPKEGEVRMRYPANDPENGPAYRQRWTGVRWICHQHNFFPAADDDDEGVITCRHCGEPPCLYDMIVEGRAIIAAAQEDLGFLMRGQRRDLLTDQSKLCETREQIEEVERIIWETPIVTVARFPKSLGFSEQVCVIEYAPVHNPPGVTDSCLEFPY